MKLGLCALALLLSAQVQAGRPPEAIARDRDAADAEVHDLERRARALDDAQAERQEQLKHRLRAIYKLSQGGLVRVLLGSESASDFELRHRAMRRLLARDLEELAAVRDDSRALDEAQSERASSLARAVELDQKLKQAKESPEPTGLWAQKGHLLRPVPGPIVASFGSYRDPAPPGKTAQASRPIVLARPGAELRARAGETVVAIAAGEVRFVGLVPGHGLGVAIDHGDGYVTITAGLTELRVGRGQPVQAGAPLGDAIGPTLYLELAQGGTPLDPSPWLTRPKR